MTCGNLPHFALEHGPGTGPYASDAGPCGSLGFGAPGTGVADVRRWRTTIMPTRRRGSRSEVGRFVARIGRGVDRGASARTPAGAA